MVEAASTGQQMAWPMCQEEGEVVVVSDSTEGRAKGLLECSDGLPSQFSGVSLHISKILLDFPAVKKNPKYQLV